MATTTASRAAATFPLYRSVGAGALCCAYGTNEVASAESKSDIVKFCKVPPCDVVGGFLMADDLDTGTEAYELDIGTSDDADQLLDSGVLTGDAVTDILPTYASAALNFRLFNGLKDGPVNYTADTTIQGTVTAAANAGGTGTQYCNVQYITG